MSRFSAMLAASTISFAVVRICFVISLFAFFIFISSAHSVGAATFRVDSTTDDPLLSACVDATPNDCSVRGAINAANAAAGADTIIVPAGTYTLTIATTDEDANANGDLDVIAGSTITVVGAYARTTFIQAGTIGGVSGNGVDRVFDVLAGGSLMLNNLTVRNGRTTGAGGGIRNAGTLNVHRVTVADNRTTGGSGAGGIEILTATTTTIDYSTISGNSVSVSSGGGIRTIGTAQVFIANTTISGNTAQQTGGGGIRAQSGAGGLISITNCTISGNTLNTNTGGGLSNSTTMRLRNTIVAGNVALASAATNDIGAGTFASGGTNIIGVPGTSTGWISSGATADYLNTQPNIGPLQNNGSWTDTHQLLAPSPAIDAGQDCVTNSTCDTFNAASNLTFDQRGYLRIPGGDFSPLINGIFGAATTDIGAFEFAAVAPPTAANVSVNGRVLIGNSGLTNAVVVLTDGQGNTRTTRTGSFGYFSFDGIQAGQTVIVSIISKKYSFAPQVVSVAEDLTELNFIALE